MSNKIKFNKKQRLAIQKVDKFIDQVDSRYFYLFGYAGTGKTFLISQIIAKLLRDQKIENVYVCAPTNVALNILSSYFKKVLDPDKDDDVLKRIIFLTIHRLLELRPHIANENGMKIFDNKDKSKALTDGKKKLIVIDECSMISSGIITSLDEYAQTEKMKTIFLGDHKQLNPVNEKESKVFSMFVSNYEYHILLDEIMRTKSDNIKDACGAVREWDYVTGLNPLIESLIAIHNRKGSKSFKMFHKKKTHVGTTWFKYIIGKINGGLTPIILPWTNGAADFYNDIIRKEIHPDEDLTDFLTGDCLIFNDYYQGTKREPDGSVSPTKFYTANMCKIVSIEPGKPIDIKWRSVRAAKQANAKQRAFNSLLSKFDSLMEISNIQIAALTVQRILDDGSIDEHPTYINTISRVSMSEYNDLIGSFKKSIELFYKKYKSEKYCETLWKKYYGFLIEPYANINYSYSITTHKAQGSTYPIACVDLQNISLNSNKVEMARALYTAMTRASEELLVLI